MSTTTLTEPMPGLGVRAGTPIPFILTLIVVVTLLAPEETSFLIFGLRLTITRIMLLSITPFIILRLLQRGPASTFRFGWPDFWVVATGGWMFASSLVTEELDRGFVGGGILAMEFVIPYWAARVLLTKPGEAEALAKVLAITIAVVGALAILDTLAGNFVIHELFSAVTGYQKGWRPDYRLNFLRAMSTMEHPILLGTTCVFGLLLSMTLSGGLRWIAIAGATIGLVLALSSAPLLSAAQVTCLLIYGAVFQGWEAKWRILLVIGGGLMTAIFLIYPNPLGFLYENLTLDATTGYYRAYVWAIASVPIANSPWFGIGLTEQWFQDLDGRSYWISVDSVWLRVALSSGIPNSIFLALSLITATATAVDSPRSTSLTREEKYLGRVLSLILFVYVSIGFTVHFWGITWILMGLFTGMRAHLGSQMKLRNRINQMHQEP